MEYKILESNGVENENVDGAALNNAMAGGKDGILKDCLNDCTVFSSGSNMVSIGTGVLMIQGFRIKITDPYEHTFPATPVSDTQYHLVAKITLLSTRDVSFELLCRQKQDLTKDKLFQTESGAYEAEIATFRHSVSGEIKDITKTMEYLNPTGLSVPAYEGWVTVE